MSDTDTLTTMNREEILEKIVALTETIENLDPLLEEQREKLESDRDKLIQSVNRARGNPHGNLKAIKPYMFSPKNPDAPLTNRISLRVTEGQFAKWSENREGFTLKIREMLETTCI